MVAAGQLPINYNRETSLPNRFCKSATPDKDADNAKLKSRTKALLATNDSRALADLLHQKPDRYTLATPARQYEQKETLVLHDLTMSSNFKI